MLIGRADLVAGFIDATPTPGDPAVPGRAVRPRQSADRAGNIGLAMPNALGGYRVTTETGGSKVDLSVPQEATSALAMTATTGAGNIGFHAR